MGPPPPEPGGPPPDEPPPPEAKAHSDAHEGRLDPAPAARVDEQMEVQLAVVKPAAAQAVQKVGQTVAAVAAPRNVVIAVGQPLLQPARVSCPPPEDGGPLLPFMEGGPPPPLPEEHSEEHEGKFPPALAFAAAATDAQMVVQLPEVKLEACHAVQNAEQTTEVAEPRTELNLLEQPELQSETDI